MTLPTLTSLGENSAANVATRDVTATVADETDDALVAFIVLLDGTGSAITVDSIVIDPGGGDEASFTQKETQKTSIGNTEITEIWTLLSPPVGTFTVRVTCSEEATRLFLEVSQAVGVDQTTVTGASGTGSGEGTVASAAVTTTQADSLVVASLYHRAGDADLTPDDETELMDRVQNGINGWAGYEAAATTGSYTIQVTADSSDHWNLLGAELLAVAAAADERRPQMVKPLVQPRPIRQLRI